MISNVLKKIQRWTSIFLILVFTYLFFSNSETIIAWLTLIENKMYDLSLKSFYKPLGKNPAVVVIDIDDKSLKQELRLPWPRNKMADMADKLKNLGAKVVVFDFMYPQEEKNVAIDIFEKLEKTGTQKTEKWQEIENLYNHDAIFAESLKKEKSILGMFFGQDFESVGALPSPLFNITEGEVSQVYIPEYNAYISNIPLLQNAATSAGFINSTPDSDGIIRYAPLIVKYKSSVYGSLALNAVWYFLDVQRIKLIVKWYASNLFLEGIQMDNAVIPVDFLGRILIPYRGSSLSFPTFSATDLLHDRIPPEKINGKLCFIGATATGGGNLAPTPMSSIFPGVEINASIAQGIIENYLPFKPRWGKGVSVAILLAMGLPIAIILPFLAPISILVMYLAVGGLLIFVQYIFWVQMGIFFSFFFPMSSISIIFLFNFIFGYILEAKQKRFIRSIFGQYVSNDYLNYMLKKEGAFSLEGENKKLPVLFSDIRNFTSIAEAMTATQVKNFLNSYLTGMTGIVFEEKGTIDKYIGDAIMAFWGAPLDDPAASYHALNTALRMQEKLKEFNDKKTEGLKAPIRIGIGIATGMMYVGDMGSQFRKAYTVLGDIVNLASRLEGLTKYYHVGCIVSETTQNDTKDSFVFKKLDAVQVKGKVQPEIIYQPICKKESSNTEIESEIAAHHQALDAYCAGNWTAAKEIWEKLKTSSKSPDLYAMYLERMEKSASPGANWTGVQQFDVK